ncbi:MAG TPA: VanW family protein [Acidimicrobiia bacterium]|nr:VanW family protein [Acidimicrobiia bacterium]
MQRLWIALIVAGIPVLALVAFAAGERILSQGDVLAGVDVAGISLAGLDETAVAEKLEPIAARLGSDPVRVTIDGELRVIDPTTIGLTVDVPATARAARRAGRGSNPVAAVGGAILRRLRADEVALAVEVDDVRLDAVLEAWRRDTAKGLLNGDVVIEGVAVRPVAPRSGTALDIGDARAALLAAWRAGDTEPTKLPYRSAPPDIDRSAVNRAVRQARRILAEPTQVTVSTRTLTLSPGDVAPTLTFTPRGHKLVVGVNVSALRVAIAPQLIGLEQPPVDATWTVDGVTATVVPAVTGQVLDLDRVGAAIVDGKHRIAGQLHVVEPDRTTAWAEGLRITELVSTYTTSHNCCEGRVTNIHRAADALDGAILEPGELFSLNETLGPRTIERGYVAAPAIGEDLELVEDVGGGVSQLSTTLFNATWFGGYKDVIHEVHSFYISRYPFGREATLNYPSIDNQFRNDSDAGILIKTSYSDTSITVSFYGSKDGRSVTSEGPFTLETIEAPVEYELDLTLEPGTQVITSPGAEGYVVRNIRIIHREGRPDVRQTFTARYRPRPRRISLNPTPVPAVPEPAPPAAEVLPPAAEPTPPTG